VNAERAPAVSMWATLRQFTPARVALGRSGGSVPTREMLDFRLAHARAKDALLKRLDEERLASDLERASGGPVLRVSSAARDLKEYLSTPESGRVLSSESVTQLGSVTPGSDLAVVVSEGLSALAAETHAAPVVEHLFPLLRGDGWTIAPLVLARRARVALEDHAGEVLRTRFALILLGERPGMAAPDSLGAYLVFQPRRGNTDAQRNCVSNISSIGLRAAEAARKLHWLLTEARRRQVSGVALKDEASLLRSVTLPALQTRAEL
jgi:ethanolamine ammonia-lyase small subunit